MARISFTSGNAAGGKRPPPWEVLGIENAGPSRRGSTYYKSLLACPREHALRYVVGLKPARPTEALTVGWLDHLCKERYFDVIQRHQLLRKVKDDDYFWGADKEGQREAFRLVDELDREDGYRDTCALERRMLEAYFDTYTRAQKWEILAVEETLEYEGAVEYTARLDLVVADHKRAEGRTNIVEHKTTKLITSDLVDSYQLDLQILGQVWLFERCVDLEAYPAFNGVIVNIVSKQKRVATQRVPCLPSLAHLAAFERSIANWRMTRDFYESLGWPQSLGHCAGYARGYSKCPYYNICNAHPDLTVEDLMGLEPPEGYIKEINDDDE